METTTSNLLTRILQAGLAFLLILAPIPFGSVQEEWIFVLEFGIFLLAGLWIFHELARGRIGLVQTGLHWPLLLLLCYLVLTLIPLPPSILRALSPETFGIQEYAAKTLSGYGLARDSLFRISLTPFDTHGEILKIISFMVFFLLSLQTLRHHEGLITFYVLLIAYGALMSLFGLVQSTWSNGKIYWRFESGGGSPFGPFVNHNHFAGYLELCLGLSLGMFVGRVRRCREQSGSAGIIGYFDWIWQGHGGRPWLLFIASFVILAGLVASLSRGAVLSVVCTAAVFTVAAILPLRSPEARAGAVSPLYRRALILIIFVLTVGLIALLMFSPRAKSRWQNIYDQAAEYRVDVWRDSMGAIRDFPVTGAGLGSFRSLYPRYKSGNFDSETTHAENEYVQWLVETGGVGLALAGILFVIFTYRILARLRDRRDVYVRSLTSGALFSLLCLSFHNLMDFNLHIPSNALTFSAAAALCVLAVNFHFGRHGGRSLLEERALRLRGPGGIMALAAVLIGLAGFGRQVWVQYQSVRAAEQWSRDKVYLLRGDREESQFALLQGAVESLPWNDRAYFLKASAYEAASAGSVGLLQLFERRGFIEQARIAVLEAIRGRPLQAAYWAALGRIETAARKKEAAELAFQQALKLAGSSATIRRDYALSLLSSGAAQRGAEQLAIARIFGPNLTLRDLLETLAKYTNDERIWQTPVREEPGDLRIYAAFLGSHGLPQRGAEILKQAAALENAPGRN